MTLADLLSKGTREGACLIWTGVTVGNGYGKIKVDRRTWRVHRLAYTLAFGDPGRLCVLHRCDNPPCFNPDHLFLGHHADNIADMLAKGRMDLRACERNGMSKLTTQDVLDIRAGRAAGLSLRAMARTHGVSKKAVLNVVMGRTWTRVKGGGVAMANNDLLPTSGSSEGAGEELVDEEEEAPL